MSVPQSFLDQTPPGLSQQDADTYRSDRELLLADEIGATPPADPNDPNPTATALGFRANKATVIASLISGTRALRVAIATAATVQATTTGTTTTQGSTTAGGIGLSGQPTPAIPAAGAPPPVHIAGPLRSGGISTHFGGQMAWTGGGRIPATRLTEPKSITAYRPSEYKEIIKVVKDCQAGLAEDHQLGAPQDIFKEGDGISFRLWNDKIKSELEERGMDGPFRILHTNGTQETYLLDEFGKATHDDVEAWIDGLRTVPCRYEEQNLAMSAKFIKASLKIDILGTVERNVRVGASGPEVYAAVVNLHQRVSTSAVRKLVDKLSKMSLKDEPGEDVEKFAGKVADIAKRIIGTGTPPPDLVALIYKAFTKSSVETFRNAANSYYERADEKDPVYDNWEVWLLKLQMRYRRDCDNDEWEPLKHNKESVALVGPVDGGSDTRTCYHCGKKGHIKPNCPDKDKPAVSGSSGPSGKVRGSHRTPPVDGAPHTKLIDGMSYSWCGTCKRWNTGTKAHLTAEHKARPKPDDGKVEAAGVTAVPTEPVANVGTVNPLSDNPYFALGYVGSICDRLVDCCFTVDDGDDDARDGDLDFSEEALSEEVLSEEADSPPQGSTWSVLRYLNFSAGQR